MAHTVGVSVRGVRLAPVLVLLAAALFAGCVRGSTGSHLAGDARGGTTGRTGQEDGEPLEHDGGSDLRADREQGGRSSRFVGSELRADREQDELFDPDHGSEIRGDRETREQRPGHYYGEDWKQEVDETMEDGAARSRRLFFEQIGMLSLDDRSDSGDDQELEYGNTDRYDQPYALHGYDDDGIVAMGSASPDEKDTSGFGFLDEGELAELRLELQIPQRSGSNVGESRVRSGSAIDERVLKRSSSSRLNVPMNDPTDAARWADAPASPTPCVYDAAADALDALAAAVAALRAELYDAHGAEPACFLDAMRPDLDGDEWAPGSYYDLDPAAIESVLDDASGSIAALMAQAAALPSHNGSPPAVPHDRRAQLSSRVRIATYNCEHLTLFGTRLYGDRVAASNYVHALAVARVLEALDADVVVLHEVEGFGVLELVRQLMANGAEYRAYCNERADAELGFRSALLTRIDPVAPLGWIADPCSDDIRHFLARLHVWTDEPIARPQSDEDIPTIDDEPIGKADAPEPFLPLDVLGVHLPRRIMFESHTDKANALAAAIVRRERHLAAMGHAVPLVVAGDLNSDFVDADRQAVNVTPDQRERAGGLYALHEDTGLVGCFVDMHRDRAGTHERGRRLDHILVPAGHVHMARNIAAQLRTRVFRDAPPFPPGAFLSDHFPVVIDFDLVRRPVLDFEWCYLTIDEIGRRRAISASSSTASVLHADVIADRANLPGMYPHAVPSYASRGRLSSSGRSARHVPSPRNLPGSDSPTRTAFEKADGPVLLSAEEQRRRAADLWAALPIGLGLDDYEEGDIDNDVGDAEAHTTAVFDEWRSTMGGYFNNEDDDADDEGPEDAGRADRENTPDEYF